MGDTKIEWTDKTWNPIRGCSRVSAGCTRYYAERMAARFSGPGMPYEGLAENTKNGPRWTGEVRLVEEHLEDPLRWQKPQRIFVNSMSDLFHERLPFEHIHEIFRVMSLADWHVYQVLTKRPARMREYVRWSIDRSPVNGIDLGHGPLTFAKAHRHVWLGVSVEDQATADERIPLLLDTPAAVRWISAEPLLGPIDFNHCRAWSPETNDYFLEGINWVVVGGESGPGARPFDLRWARDLRDQCRRADVPVFIKQMGSAPERTCAPCLGTGETLTGTPDLGRDWCPDCGGTREGPLYRSRKGGDPSEWPADLRVREFPRP